MNSLIEFVRAVSLLLFLAALLFPFVGSLVWLHRDAKLRGKPPGRAVLLVALVGSPLSLVFWLVMRPAPQLWSNRDHLP